MRCDGEPVRPGIGTTRLMSRVFKPAKQIGTRSAYTIRASGLKTPRQQAGHKTVPDLAAASKCPCKAGAIHTSGAKERMGRISKMGDRYLRRLLVSGMTSQIQAARRKPDAHRGSSACWPASPTSWLPSPWPTKPRGSLGSSRPGRMCDRQGLSSRSVLKALDGGRNDSGSLEAQAQR